MTYELQDDLTAHNDSGAQNSDHRRIWIGDLPEAEQLKRLGRLESDITEIKERWNNRLVLEECAFGEEYARGRLAIACYFGPGSKNALVLVLCADSGESLNRGDANQELMFVEVVQSGNLPNLTVASMVRLYFINNEVRQIGEGNLYLSQRTGGYKVLPFGPRRERNSIVVFPDIECNDRGERIQLQKICSRLRVRLYTKFAEVRLKESIDDMVQLMDVALGPLNL